MNNELYHYNHNHDRLGRFARAANAVGSSVTSIGSKRKNGSSMKEGIFSRKNKKKQEGSKSNNTKLSASERERIIKSGSIKEVTKHKDKLSNRELETAINRLNKEKVARINLEKRLSDLNGPKKKTGMEFVSDAVNTAGKFTDMANKAINTWNTIAKIHNSMYPDKWKTIDGKYEKETDPRIQKIIRSGNAKDIEKNRTNMTIKEYGEAIQRLKNDQALYDAIEFQKNNASTKNYADSKYAEKTEKSEARTAKYEDKMRYREAKENEKFTKEQLKKMKKKK